MQDIRHEVKPGMIVKVHQKIKDVNSRGEEKERIQIFEGIVLAVKHGSQAGATFTVRKDSKGFGVEKIFPTHSPIIAGVEFVRQMKVKQSRPYFVRGYKKKLKEIKNDTKKTSSAKKASVKVAKKADTTKKEEAKAS